MIAIPAEVEPYAAGEGCSAETVRAATGITREATVDNLGGASGRSVAVQHLYETDGNSTSERYTRLGVMLGGDGTDWYYVDRPQLREKR